MTRKVKHATEWRDTAEGPDSEMETSSRTTINEAPI